MASITPAKIILSDPSSWDQWYEDTLGTVPSQMCKYFEPDTEAVLIEPEPPVRPVDEPAPVGAETPQARKARLARNQREQDMYYKDYTVYQGEKREWDKFHDVDAKLRERIQTTVAPSKKAALRRIFSVRKWLTDLRDSTALPDENIRQNIQLEYKKLMGSVYVDWPTGGPTTWLAKWEELINRAIRYDEPLRTWLRDICLVWERVPELSVFFAQVQLNLEAGNTAGYSHSSVSLTIQRRWEHKSVGLSLRVINRPKATRSAFATDVTFNEEAAPDVSDTTNTTTVSLAKKKGNRRGRRSNRGRQGGSKVRDRSRSSKPDRSRSPKPDRNQPLRQTQAAKRDNKYRNDPCSACGGSSHSFNRCYLVQGKDRDWILEENREIFRSNMDVASFKKKVEDFRKAWEITQRTRNE